MLNQKEVMNNWPKLKNRILKLWTKLSLKDVEETHGNINLLRRLVQRKYGLAEDFNNKLEELADAHFRGNLNEALVVSTFHLKL